MVAIDFGKLGPSWDCSWYEPSRLDGFEGELVGELARYDFFPRDFAEIVTHAFEIQRAHVNVAAEASCKQNGVCA